MPSIHYLNPPPNPFWDFVANLEYHPFFAPYGRPPNLNHPQQGGEQAEQPASTQAEQPEMSENARGKQTEAEDPPEVDPSTLKEDKPKGTQSANEGPERRWHGRDRFSGAFGEDDMPRRGHGWRGRGGFGGRGGPHHHGGPPHFPFGHPGPWARRGSPQDFEGPHGPGPHHHHHHHHHPHHPPHPRADRGPNGFNLGEFLNNLGQRLGVDLSGAAEGLGIDRFTGSGNSDSDFEPRTDIFDTPTSYVIHVSLPGAKKEDVGVDWDGENSHLRIAGVVHRPGADEQLLSQLVVDGRKRETGVFEKVIRLGTKRQPASINIDGIAAKMADGVLVVKVPKVEMEPKKRDVAISASGSPSPARQSQPTEQEKTHLMEDDDDMYETYAPSAAPTTTAAKEKEAEHRREVEANREQHDARSETMDYEQPEQLPAYQAEEAHSEEDWEKAGSDEEGEYVKINVD